MFLFSCSSFKPYILRLFFEVIFPNDAKCIQNLANWFLGGHMQLIGVQILDCTRKSCAGQRALMVHFRPEVSPENSSPRHSTQKITLNYWIERIMDRKYTTEMDGYPIVCKLECCELTIHLPLTARIIWITIVRAIGSRLSTLKDIGGRNSQTNPQRKW